MDGRRKALVDELERYYRSCGWKVELAEDGTVRAAGAGGVTWIGLVVLADDLGDEALAERIVDLSDVRESDGARCPFEILPEPECAGAVHSLLNRLRLSERVAVYSVAA